MKFLRGGRNHRVTIKQLKLGLSLTLLAALTGCVGVDGGYYGGSTVVVAGPEVGFWGGGFRHDDVRFSHRGAESRGAAHSSHGGRR